VSDVADPNDVDVILVMHDDFLPENCSAESCVLFDHVRAMTNWAQAFFWVRPGMLLGEPLDLF